MVVSVVVVLLSHRDHSRGSVHLHGPGQAHTNRTGVCLITAYPPVCPHTSRHDTTQAQTPAHAPYPRYEHLSPRLVRPSDCPPSSRPLFFLPAGGNPIGLPVPQPPPHSPTGEAQLRPLSSSMQGTHVSGLRRALADRESGLLAVLPYHLRTTLVLYLTCGNWTIRGGLWCGC